MASADFLQFVVTTRFFSVCKTSSGKRYHLHLIYLLHLHLEIRAILDFILCRKLVRFKMPYMQFLFVRPRFCFRLPSDSASQRTPLPLANSSYCQVCSGLSPPSNNACRAHYKKEQERTAFTRRTLLLLCIWTIYTVPWADLCSLRYRSGEMP